MSDRRSRLDLCVRGLIFLYPGRLIRIGLAQHLRVDVCAMLITSTLELGRKRLAIYSLAHLVAYIANIN